MIPILCSRECYFIDVLIFATENNGVTEQIYDYKEMLHMPLQVYSLNMGGTWVV